MPCGSGAPIPLEFPATATAARLGADFILAGFSLTAGVEGKLLLGGFDDASFTVIKVLAAPSYGQMVLLTASDTTECLTGSLGLTLGLFSDLFGNVIPFCGTIDMPCPQTCARFCGTENPAGCFCDSL